MPIMSRGQDRHNVRGVFVSESGTYISGTYCRSEIANGTNALLKHVRDNNQIRMIAACNFPSDEEVSLSNVYPRKYVAWVPTPRDVCSSRIQPKRQVTLSPPGFLRRASYIIFAAKLINPKMSNASVDPDQRGVPCSGNKFIEARDRPSPRRSRGDRRTEINCPAKSPHREPIYIHTLTSDL